MILKPYLDLDISRNTIQCREPNVLLSKAKVEYLNIPQLLS